MRLPQLACCTLLGILPLLILPELPPVGAIKLSLPGLIALAFCGRAGRAVCLTGLLFCWGVFAAWQVVLPAETLPVSDSVGA